MTLPPDQEALDAIEITGVRVFGRHGVMDHEREDGQVFVLDVTLWADLEAAAQSDDIADTINYAEIAAEIETAVKESSFNLLEALAGHVIDGLFRDDRVMAAEVRVAKPHAPVPVDVEDVAVTVARTRSA